MKLKLLAGLILFGIVGSAQAYSWRELRYNVRDNVKVSILESAIPAYFRDLESGRNRAGVVTPILTAYEGVFTADAGWLNTIDNSKDVGSALLGGSLHFDKFFRAVLPDQADFIRSLIPDPAQKFTDKISMGFYTAHSFERNGFTYGIYSGIQLEF